MTVDRNYTGFDVQQYEKDKASRIAVLERDCIEYARHIDEHEQERKRLNTELDAKAARIKELEQRIRELEALMVPGGFPSDVMTAAGLVYHGKRDKVLAERLSIGAQSMLAAAPAPAPVILASRCPMCFYQHGHQIGCENNPVDIALLAIGQKKEEE